MERGSGSHYQLLAGRQICFYELSRHTLWAPGVDMEGTCRDLVRFSIKWKEKKTMKRLFENYHPLSKWPVSIIQLAFFSLLYLSGGRSRIPEVSFNCWASQGTLEGENSCLYRKQFKGQILCCSVPLTSLNSPQERGTGVIFWAGQQQVWRWVRSGSILFLLETHRVRNC